MSDTGGINPKGIFIMIILFAHGVVTFHYLVEMGMFWLPILSFFISGWALLETYLSYRWWSE